MSPTFVSDLSALTKPRITLMVMLTAMVGYWMAASPFDLWLLIDTMIGTALLASGSSVFNQVLERASDARMERTAKRPLVTGRMSLTTALIIGIASSLVGTVWLLWRVNALTASLGALTLVLYVAIYTPLKRKSSLSTLVGAVPGAIPPMMGVTAATGVLGPLAWSLFGILFLWQMPHFLAISWMYKDDYERGGMPMLSATDTSGRLTAAQAVLYAAALIPVSLVPGVLGFSGVAYLIGAVVCGLAFLAASMQFRSKLDRPAARRLLLTSVLYLPAVLTLLVVDRIIPYRLTIS